MIIFYTFFLLGVLIIPSAFFERVPIIIGSGSKKKMGWANACPNIAFMANKQPIRDFSVMHFPRKPMGSYGFMVYVKPPISRLESIPYPKPASTCFVNEIPKVFRRIFRHHEHLLGQS